MYDHILKTYVKTLESPENRIIGVYIQGSNVIGYSDNYSDVDYSVIWKSNYPSVNLRKPLLERLNLPINYIGDQDHKGTDRFIYNDKEHNIAHRLDHNFFNIYHEVQTKKVNEPKLYILGGFKRGEILYDPDGELKRYIEKLAVTPEIVELFKETRRNSTTKSLSALQIAAKREQPVEFVKSLNYLLITFSIQLYLENRQFPVSPKWVEDDATKYGWESPFLDVLKKIKDGNNFEQLSDLLNEVKDQLQLL